jgi:hypothetical protein
MALHFKHNLYHGVNAHLHSYYQAEGGWAGFHGNYIARLLGYINDVLPEGYIVDSEKSLQIREYHPDTGERLRRPKPDLGLYKQQSLTKPTLTSPAYAPTITLPLMESLVLTDDLFFVALRIYKLQVDSLLGKPVTQIELLSPSNKPPGDGYLQYHEKRHILLKTGMQIVEIDLFQETDSPIGGIPAYRYGESNATPYYVAISLPVPDLIQGKLDIYGFAVDEDIPTIAVPLEGSDSVAVDFNTVYHQTFLSTNAYSLRANYEQLPLNFDRYTETDQERIRAVMERARAEAAKES